MNDRDWLVRRILVALDSSTSAPAGLDVAVDLASRLRAELQGLYVEDDNLFRIAALPFPTQVSLTTGGKQPLEAADLEQQMARLADAARHRMAQAAERGRVPWSFRTVRGRIAHEVAIAAKTVDLVIVEGGRHNAPAQARIGLSAGTTIQGLTRSVLVLRAGRRFEGPATVIFDATPLGEKALRMADILTPDSDLLTVLIANQDSEKQASLEARARELLGESAGSAHFRTLEAASLSALCEEVHDHDPGLLILGADDPLLPENNVAKVLDSLACPVLLVR